MAEGWTPIKPQPSHVFGLGVSFHSGHLVLLLSSVKALVFFRNGTFLCVALCCRVDLLVPSLDVHVLLLNDCNRASAWIHVVMWSCSCHAIPLLASVVALVFFKTWPKHFFFCKYYMHVASWCCVLRFWSSDVAVVICWIWYSCRHLSRLEKWPSAILSQYGMSSYPNSQSFTCSMNLIWNFNI